MHLPGTGFCIYCGAHLEASHRFCWKCGAARWQPEPELGPERPPPGPGTTPFQAPAPATSERPARAIPWLLVFFAAGAVYFLVTGAETAAYLVSPAGREQLMAELAKQAVPGNLRAAVLALQVVFVLAGAALHAASFYGLRARRRWGWVVATLVAGLWSLVLIGIPLLVLLLRRSTRRAFGLA